MTVTKIDPGRRLGQRALAVPGGHDQDHALRRHAADAARRRCSSRRTPSRGPVLKAGRRPRLGRRRAGGADRAARRPRHGVRPPEGPARQRHGAGERAVALPATRTAWPTTNRPATRPATSSSTTCPRARTSSSTRRASCTRASTRPAWPRSSACTPPSSTAIARAYRSRLSDVAGWHWWHWLCRALPVQNCW